MFTKSELDNQFLEIFKQKLSEISPEKKSALQVIDFETLFNMSSFINGLKPKSKYRIYKTKILEVLIAFKQVEFTSKKEEFYLIDSYLHDLIHNLQRDHSFVDKSRKFWSAVFSLVIDVILIITIKYYFIPMITIATIVRYNKKIKKAKEEKKYINF